MKTLVCLSSPRTGRSSPSRQPLPLGWALRSAESQIGLFFCMCLERLRDFDCGIVPVNVATEWWKWYRQDILVHQCAEKFMQIMSSWCKFHLIRREESHWSCLTGFIKILVSLVTLVTLLGIKLSASWPQRSLFLTYTTSVIVFATSSPTVVSVMPSVHSFAPYLLYCTVNHEYKSSILGLFLGLFSAVISVLLFITAGTVSYAQVKNETNANK